MAEVALEQSRLTGHDQEDQVNLNLVDKILFSDLFI